MNLYSVITLLAISSTLPHHHDAKMMMQKFYNLQIRAKSRSLLRLFNRMLIIFHAPVAGRR